MILFATLSAPPVWGDKAADGILHLEATHRSVDAVLPPAFQTPDQLPFFKRAGMFILEGINGENATLLITGGLFIIIFVLGASILNTFISGGEDFADPELNSVFVAPLEIRSGKISSNSSAGMNKAKEMKIGTLDTMFDSLVALGIGDPRMVSSSARRKILRVYNCVECQHEKGQRSRGSTCQFTKGFLTASFNGIQRGQVLVEETKCRGSGADYCEYSIVFGEKH